MEHRQFSKNFGAHLVDRGRLRRSQAICQKRAENRMDILKCRRNMDEILQVSSENKENQRLELLAKWKAQKQKISAELKKKQKPVFKTGILQRKANGSPLLRMTRSYAYKNFLGPNQLNKVNQCKTSNEGVDGVVTRSRAKFILPENVTRDKNVTKFSQIINSKRKEIQNHAFTIPSSVAALAKSYKITIPQTPKVLKPKRNLKGKTNHSVKVFEPEIIDNIKKESIVGTAKHINVVPEKKCLKKVLKVNSEVNATTEGNCGIKEQPIKEESPRQDHDLELKNDFVPIHFSPYVNKSRGSECKSPKRKINLTLDVDKIIEKEENEFGCRIYSFRKYIECETKRLLDMCENWKNITKNVEVPEEVENEISSLCGKSNLLTSDKFMQFKDLIDKCENKDPMIKVEDLQGYQDWVSIDVESLVQAFAKLEERKNNGWKDVKEPVVSHVKKGKKLLPSKQPTKLQGVKSKIRDHIMAARKAKQNDGDVNSSNPSTLRSMTMNREKSLLKEVLNSETSKLNSSGLVKTPKFNSTEKRRISGLEIITATHIAKLLTPFKKSTDSALEDHITTFTSEAQTPVKSILKQTPGSTNSLKHCVHFNLSSSGCSRKNLKEKYFQPVMDEKDYSELSIRMGDFTLTSPHKNSIPNDTSTPLRRSARLARK